MHGLRCDWCARTLQQPLRTASSHFYKFICLVQLSHGGCELRDGEWSYLRYIHMTELHFYFMQAGGGSYGDSAYAAGTGFRALVL